MHCQNRTPYDLMWLGNTYQLLTCLRQAGEHPCVPSVLNAWTGHDKPLNPPWYDLSGYVTNEVGSKDGDFALSYAERTETSPVKVVILLYRKQPKGWAWRKAGTIKPLMDSSGKVVAYPSPINWLWDGRLAYAMVYLGQDPQHIEEVELWRCRKDGSRQDKWLSLPGAQPPDETPTTEVPKWVSVSANGKRVAFLRKDKVFVFEAEELAEAQ